MGIKFKYFFYDTSVVNCSVFLQYFIIPTYEFVHNYSPYFFLNLINKAILFFFIPNTKY